MTTICVAPDALSETDHPAQLCRAVIASTVGPDRRALHAPPALQRLFNWPPAVVSNSPAPLIATALLAMLGSSYMIAAYILFCAIVSIISTALLPDYANRDISEEFARQVAPAAANASNRQLSFG